MLWNTMSHLAFALHACGLTQCLRRQETRNHYQIHHGKPWCWKSSEPQKCPFDYEQLAIFSFVGKKSFGLVAGSPVRWHCGLFEWENWERGH